MEKHIALINKSTDRVENVLVVGSLEPDFIKAWETDQVKVVPVTDSIPYVYGLWTNLKFEPPTSEYLIEIGMVQPEPEIELEIESDDKSSSEV